MNKSHRNLYIITAIISMIIPLFSRALFASEIEIQPIMEGQEYCLMKLGETQTFTASGIGWDKDTKHITPGAQITGIQWSFDARFLELQGTGNNSITLRAIKERTSRLTVTGIVDGKTATKTIFVVIKKEGPTSEIRIQKPETNQKAERPK